MVVSHQNPLVKTHHKKTICVPNVVRVRLDVFFGTGLLLLSHVWQSGILMTDRELGIFFFFFFFRFLFFFVFVGFC